ncbi:hypothetical protein SCANM63S_00173 [Streptomyces canarius]
MSRTRPPLPRAATPMRASCNGPVPNPKHTLRNGSAYRRVGPARWSAAAGRPGLDTEARGGRRRARTGVGAARHRLRDGQMEAVAGSAQPARPTRAGRGRGQEGRARTKARHRRGRAAATGRPARDRSGAASLPAARRPPGRRAGSGSAQPRTENARAAATGGPRAAAASRRQVRADGGERNRQAPEPATDDPTTHGRQPTTADVAAGPRRPVAAGGRQGEAEPGMTAAGPPPDTRPPTETGRGRAQPMAGTARRRPRAEERQRRPWRARQGDGRTSSRRRRWLKAGRPGRPSTRSPARTLRSTGRSCAWWRRASAPPSPRWRSRPPWPDPGRLSYPRRPVQLAHDQRLAESRGRQGPWPLLPLLPDLGEG